LVFADEDVVSGGGHLFGVGGACGDLEILVFFFGEFFEGKAVLGARKAAVMMPNFVRQPVWWQMPTTGEEGMTPRMSRPSGKVCDQEEGHFDLKGTLGLQLRAGEPMTVQCKDIQFHELP